MTGSQEPAGASVPRPGSVRLWEPPPHQLPAKLWLKTMLRGNFPDDRRVSQVLSGLNQLDLCSGVPDDSLRPTGSAPTFETQATTRPYSSPACWAQLLPVLRGVTWDRGTGAPAVQGPPQHPCQHPRQGQAPRTTGHFPPPQPGNQPGRRGEPVAGGQMGSPWAGAPRPPVLQALLSRPDPTAPLFPALPAQQRLRPQLMGPHIWGG